MSIKIIIALIFVLLVGFIGYNNYSSYQSRKSAEARRVETQAIQAGLSQQPQSKPKVVPSATVVGVPVVNQPQDDGVESLPVAADSELFDVKVTEKAEPENKVDDSICDSVIPVAEKVMRARQDGIAISNSLDFANNIKDGTPATESVSNITKQMVVDAYGMPSFSTESNKDKAVREFGARQYLACMSAFN